MFPARLVRLLSTTYPDGTTETYTYDAEGNTLIETDRLGRTTRYEYDALGRVARTVYPDGTATQNEYDAAGQLVAAIDERGSRTEHAYDAAGRRISTTDPLGHVTRFGYDANGNRTSVTDANGNTTQFVFDALDRLVETLHPDGTSTAETFDAVGQRTAATDELGRSTGFAWDAEGRLTQVTDPLGNVTRYGYDEHGNKVSQTDAEGRTTRWGYDLYGRMTAHTLPLGQTERWVLDTAGIVQRHRDFDGNEAFYTNDSDDRPTRIVYPDGNVETFVYDAVGNRIEAADANGTTTYAYDARDRLVHESRPDGSELLYDYDAAGNRTKVTATANGTTRVTRYVYDAAGRNTQVIDHDGRVTRQVFDAVGNLVRIELPNGLVTTHAYDSRHRLTRITTRDAGGTVLEDVRYTLDATGKRVRMDEQNGAASRSTVYTYDAAGRLTGESVSDPANGDRTATYGYDRVGNRTTETVNGIGKAYSYDANDRLLAAGATSYGYDAIGNLVLRQDASGTAAYGWDAKRRMTSASVAGKSISYRYNVDDIRTRKTVNGSATDYLVDHNTQYPQVLAELGAANDAWYTLGDSRRISRHAANDASYYLADAQGTTKALADATGDITSRYAYSGFGELITQTGSAQNDFRYTGEQYDEDLGQYYLRARYYDPSTGRFTRMDTWPGEDEYPVTLNKYVYANADPVGFSDPSGMWTIANVMTTLRVNGKSRGVGYAAAERQAAWLLKEIGQLAVDEGKGFAIDLIIREAAAALAYADEVKPNAKNAGARGTAAHERFKERLKYINGRFLNRLDIRVDADVYVVDKNGEREAAPRPRAKGSVAIDVAFYKPMKSAHPLIIFDLKTGKRMSSTKRNDYRRIYGGAPLVEIEVKVRRK